MSRESSLSSGTPQARRGIFLERYARAELENVRLHFVLYLLGVLCALFAVALVLQAVRPRPVYYVPGAVSAGISYPDQIPESAALSFASAWIMDWLNYTPETIEGVYTRAFKVMGPGLLSKVRSRSQEEKRKIVTDRLSSIFTLKDAARVAAHGRGFQVTLDGQRGIYMGKEEMSLEDARYTVILRRVPLGADNIYGLVVEDVFAREGEQDAI